jgi:hypothetical protein
MVVFDAELYRDIMNGSDSMFDLLSVPRVENILAHVQRFQLRRVVFDQVGINFLESSTCSVNDSGNAAIPAMIPTIIRNRDIKDQITPQH